MALNPKIKPFANLVPSVETKKIKKHWKRNGDKNCQVFKSFSLYFITLILNWFPLRNCFCWSPRHETNFKLRVTSCPTLKRIFQLNQSNLPGSTSWRCGVYWICIRWSYFSMIKIEWTPFWITAKQSDQSWSQCFELFAYNLVVWTAGSVSKLWRHQTYDIERTCRRTWGGAMSEMCRCPVSKVVPDPVGYQEFHRQYLYQGIR